MGPINWLAVAVSAGLALAMGWLWYGAPFARNAARWGHSGPGAIAGAIALSALSALMLGHNYARLGADRLAARPWLYWMQSGGIALAFIIPAVWIGYARRRVPRREAVVDAGFWLAVYLAQGTVFWALR